MHAYTYARACTHTYVHTCAHAHTYALTRTHICTHEHTRTHVHVHTHTHTHTHTHRLIKTRSNSHFEVVSFVRFWSLCEDTLEFREDLSERIEDGGKTSQDVESLESILTLPRLDASSLISFPTNKNPIDNYIPFCNLHLCQNKTATKTKIKYESTNMAKPLYFIFKDVSTGNIYKTGIPIKTKKLYRVCWSNDIFCQDYIGLFLLRSHVISLNKTPYFSQLVTSIGCWSFIQIHHSC